ncbi:hypothetical protein PF008_g24750 [Phytophthora fragariae]|uniref:Secreted protein n=1 Tax=Phytophthora fragariae TaxID=53985 RepID=A0A6G0QMS8_9STRA|nr:hypothetical protein PF008_g24750 [Phytophthora fragariae]
MLMLIVGQVCLQLVCLRLSNSSTSFVCRSRQLRLFDSDTTWPHSSRCPAVTQTYA